MSHVRALQGRACRRGSGHTVLLCCCLAGGAPKEAYVLSAQGSGVARRSWNESPTRGLEMRRWKEKGLRSVERGRQRMAWAKGDLEDVDERLPLYGMM